MELASSAPPEKGSEVMWRVGCGAETGIPFAVRWASEVAEPPEIKPVDGLSEKSLMPDQKLPNDKYQELPSTNHVQFMDSRLLA